MIKPLEDNPKQRQPDFILAMMSVILILLGILILASVSATASKEIFGNTYHYLKHQIIHGLLPGLFLGIVAYKISLLTLKKFAFPLLAISLLSILAVFIPSVGPRLLGANRWINIGIFSFQPSEFFKLIFIIYLAFWLGNRTKEPGAKKMKSDWKANKTFVVFLFLISAAGLPLILQPDVTTTGIIIATALLMYFLSNTPIWHTLAIFFMAGGGLWFLIKIAPYRFNRMLVFLKPGTDPMGIGFQSQQAVIAVGSGGLFGLGLGLSRQKFGFLPQSMSDTIFTVFAEETGFLGALILISLFLVFLWRGFYISNKVRGDKFSKLLAQGITFWVVLQAFVNIGAMIGVLPLVGIPLPFISYGGSHLIAELTALGLLLNISKNTD